MELAWNFRGTFTLDFEVVIRFCGTCVELWWDLGGTLKELLGLGESEKKTPSMNGALIGLI